MTTCELEMTDAARAAVGSVGRSEDMRFSPDNRTLAIAGYDTRQCLLLRVEVADGPRLRVTDFLRLTSDGVGLVHGLDFIGDRTLALASRDGDVAVVEVPPGEFAGRSCDVAPRAVVATRPAGAAYGPGSVAAARDLGGRVGLLVCQTFGHAVTRHVVDPRAGYKSRVGRPLLARGLVVPDGVALSHDGRWVAVSSHETHDVKLFERTPFLGPRSEPAAALPGAGYPHGLRFTADDRRLVVADAGAPLVHVYERGDGWGRSHGPARSFRIMDDETFTRGRTHPVRGVNVKEGGPKGLDVDRSGALLVTTCQEQPLGVFPMAAVVGGLEVAAAA